MDRTQQQIQNLAFELIRTNLLVAELIAGMAEDGYLQRFAVADKLRADVVAANKRLNSMIKE